MRLPESWVETTVGKVVVDLQPGFAQKPGEDDEGMTPQIRTHNISPDGKITLEGIKHVSASAKELERYVLTKGDVVFNNTNSEEWVGKTAVFDQDGEYVFSNHMTRLRPDNALVASEYLAGYLQLLWSMGYSKTRAKRWVSQAGIEGAALASFKLPLPTRPEQQRIVDVLRQAQAINQLRSQFNKLASRIKCQLFIEMFGDPSHRHNKAWPVIKLGSVVTVATGGTPSRAIADNYGGEIAWAKSTDLTDTEITSTEEQLTKVGLQNSNAKVYPKNTVLLAMYGQGQTRGRTAKLLIDAACNQACAALLPNEELLPDYLWVWLQLSYDSVRALGRGGQQENLNLDIVRNLKIPQPPVPLQEIFARRLEHLLGIEKNARTAEKQISAMLNVLRLEALTGLATEAWRDQHHNEITQAAEARDTLLRERGAKPASRPPEPAPLVAPSTAAQLPNRQWLLDELSEFQRLVLDAFLVYPAQPLLAEDPDVFGNFCESEALGNTLEAFPPSSPNHIRRTLSQLAALGLIAKITLPKMNPITGEREYLTAFRPLRDGDRSRSADVALLRRTLRDTSSQVTYSFEVGLDYETSARAGAAGMFQVASLTDDEGGSHEHLVDQGKHYTSLKEVTADIARALSVAADQIVLVEV